MENNLTKSEQIRLEQYKTRLANWQLYNKLKEDSKKEKISLYELEKKYKAFNKKGVKKIWN